MTEISCARVMRGASLPAGAPGSSSIKSLLSRGLAEAEP